VAYRPQNLLRALKKPAVANDGRLFSDSITRHSGMRRLAQAQNDE
jgi:hypothetical protein